MYNVDDLNFLSVVQRGNDFCVVNSLKPPAAPHQRLVLQCLVSRLVANEVLIWNPFVGKYDCITCQEGISASS